MIWLAWRRQRTQVLVSLGVIVLAAVLIMLDASSDIDFDGSYGVSDYFASEAAFLLPVALGAFAGGPLFARETSKGTHTFVLTQSASRWRWWASRLVIATVPIVVALLGLSRVHGWSGSAVAPEDVLRTPDFEVGGTLLAAYFLLTAAIGAVAGLLVRSSTGAIAITVAGYFVIAVVIGFMVRPHLLPSTQQEFPLEAATGHMAHDEPEGLLTDDAYLDDAGEPVPDVVDECGYLYECMRDKGVVAHRMTYIPGDRYWSLQWMETGLLAVGAAIMVGAGAWRLRGWYP